MTHLRKQAAGEIIGGLAGLASRPFVGAARSKGIQEGIAKGITRNVAAPIENAYKRTGARKGIAWLASQGARDVPGTPRLFMKARGPAERAAFGERAADLADKGVSMLAHNPETIPMQAVPVPGLTPGWMAAKAGMRRALGVPQMTTEMAKLGHWMPSLFEEIAAMVVEEEFEKTAQLLPYQQSTQWSCSAACLKAVLAHYGEELPEIEAVGAIGARRGRGAEVTEISEAARKLGYEAFDYSFDSMEQAKALLDADMPIICDIQSFNYPGKGHYVVMVSADDQTVNLMDPNTPGNWRTISRQEMDERWWDHRMEPPHDVVAKWGIVVLPKEET